MASGIVTRLAFQGRLTGVDGRPVTSGSYSLAFALHADRSTSRTSWTEVQQAIPVAADGSFSVLLGSVNPLGTKQFNGRVRWLSVRRIINGEPEDEVMDRACVMGTPLQLTERLLALESTVSAQAELLEKYESGPSPRALAQQLARLESLLEGFAPGELDTLRAELSTLRTDTQRLMEDGGRLDNIEYRLDDLDGPDSDIVDLNARVDALEGALSAPRRGRVKSLAKG